MKLLWIAVAGALGTLARYWLGGKVQRITGGTFPMADKIPYDRMDHGMWPESVVNGTYPVMSSGVA